MQFSLPLPGVKRIGKAWALILLCFLLYLPGLSSLPATDRDESRYMQATRQMVDSGDMIDIRFQDEARYKKPVGIYWLQAGFAYTAKAFGAAANERTPYRLPSMLGATGAVLLLYLGFKNYIGERQAFSAAVLLACTLLVGVEAHLAKTDAMQLAAIVAMQVGMVNLTCEPRSYGLWQFRLLFWLGLGLGVLIKGPVAPTVAALTLGWMCWQARSFGPLKALQPLPWLVLPVLMVGPWLLSIQGLSEGQFIQDSFGHDFLAKIFEGQESHGAPPGTYLLTTPLLLWPMSWLIIPHGWRALRSPKLRHTKVTSFAFAWLVLPWILFELVPTKLPHYVLPLLPALCLLAGMGMFKPNDNENDGLSSWSIRVGMAAWLITGAALVLGIPALSIWAIGAVSWIAALISLLCAAMLIAMPKILNTNDRMLASAASAVVVFGLIYQVFLPQVFPLWPAEALRKLTTNKELPVAISGYHEPSVVFNLDTTTLLTNLEGVARHSNQQIEAYAIIPSDEIKAFNKTLSASRKSDLVGFVKGINYSKGRKLSLVVIKTTLLGGSTSREG